MIEIMTIPRGNSGIPVGREAKLDEILIVTAIG